jgi:hypothetical protein
MPFTFFAHQLFVVPLKCARPRWFDGTALCVGSMAPDFAYALYGTPLAFASHSLGAQLLWSLPVTLLLTRLIRDPMADPLGAHLPAPLGPEVRALAHSRHSRGITAASALLGAMSHVFVDGFTHRGGWAVERFEPLRRVLLDVAGHALTTARLLQYTGHVFGTALGFALFAWLIGHARFSAWNQIAVVPTALRTRPRFWAPFAVGCCVSVPAALTVAVTGGGLPVAIIRAAWVVFAGLAVSARGAALRELPAERARQ